MDGARILLRGAAHADVRLRDDERGLADDLERLAERAVDGVEVVSVAFKHLPAVRLEARARVVHEREVGRALDRDVVRIVDEAEAVELERTRERTGLVGDALLQVAVAAEHPRAVVDDGRLGVHVPAGGVHTLGNRHAHGHRDALAKRTRRHLHARQQAALGVARTAGAELAEGLEFVELQVARAGEVEERVDERRAVPARKDEAVAVGPGNVLGVEIEEFEPEGRRNVRQAERHAGVPALRLLHHVRREAADRVGREFQLIVRKLHELSFRDGWWGRFAAEWKKRDGRRTAFRICHYTTNQGACRF